MAIGTKNVKVGTGSLPKSFTPGMHKCKINQVSHTEQNFGGGKRFWVLLDLETEPIDGFEGWFIDKDDESKGRYLGQTGRVKSDSFGYADSSYNGREYTIVDSVIRFLKQIEQEASGKTDWMDSIDGKFNTIEDIVDAFNDEAPFKDVYLNFCIGGSKEIGDDGYPKYYMYLPKWTKGKKLFTNPNAENASTLLQFDEALHIYVKGGQPAQVQNFGNDGGGAAFEPLGDSEENPFELNSDGDDEDPFAAE